MSIQGWFPLGLTCYLEYHKSHENETHSEMLETSTGQHIDQTTLPLVPWGFKGFCVPICHLARREGRRGGKENLRNWAFILPLPPPSKLAYRRQIFKNTNTFNLKSQDSYTYHQCLQSSSPFAPTYGGKVFKESGAQSQYCHYHSSIWIIVPINLISFPLITSFPYIFRGKWGICRVLSFIV